MKLRIGGEHSVDVARSTLAQVHDSMLNAMFSGRHRLKTDDKGRVFLDRDPKYFSYVLDHLRNGCPLPARLPENEEEQQRVREEFDYFQIPVETPPTCLSDFIAKGKYATTELEIPAAVQGKKTHGFGLSDHFAAVLFEESEEAFHILAWNLQSGNNSFLLDPASLPRLQPLSEVVMHGNTLGLVGLDSCQVYFYDLAALDKPPRRVGVDKEQALEHYLIIADTHVVVSYQYMDGEEEVYGLTVFDRQTLRQMFEIDLYCTQCAVFGDTLVYYENPSDSSDLRLVRHSLSSYEKKNEIYLPCPSKYDPMDFAFMGRESRLFLECHISEGHEPFGYHKFFYMFIDWSRPEMPSYRFLEADNPIRVSPDGTVVLFAEPSIQLLSLDTDVCADIDLGDVASVDWELSERQMLVRTQPRLEDALETDGPAVFTLYRILV